MKLEKLIPIFSEKFRQEKGILAVLLYGSYAKGVEKKTSDIDIAILYDYECIPTPLELWNLKTQLDQLLSLEVDLVCLNKVDPILGNQIYKYHQTILVNDPRKLAEYFNILCSKYMELKEFIRPMEEQILQRKYHAGS